MLLYSSVERGDGLSSKKQKIIDVTEAKRKRRDKSIGNSKRQLKNEFR